jgi:starch synthase
VQTLGTDLEIVGGVAGADVVHSHTWYANFAGHLASLLHGIPHVVTAHSLEPLRPWKAEQLGGGYAVSSYIEKTAYENAAAVIAVSDGMRRDILRSYPSSIPRRCV